MCIKAEMGQWSSLYAMSFNSACRLFHVHHVFRYGAVLGTVSYSKGESYVRDNAR